MTPNEYCNRLDTALHRMPPEERQETIRYYLEFLEEAGEEERASLGTPEQLAARVLQENGIFDTIAPPPKKSDGTAHIVLAICTFPIWLPLLITWYAVLFSALVCLICIPFSIGASALALIFSAILLLFHDVPMALLTLGAGLICAGITIFLWKPFWTACRAVVQFTVFTTQKSMRLLWKGSAA